MRGAAFLSKNDPDLKSTDVDVANALVADIGGTTTDIGQLVKGFPRQAGSKVEVGTFDRGAGARSQIFPFLTDWRSLHQLQNA